MGSKNNPPKYDCYANAEPDEEMFILLGRDPMAGALVRLWVMMREREGTITPDKATEARGVANRLDEWACKLDKEKRVYQAKHIMIECVGEFFLKQDDVEQWHVDRFIDDWKEDAYARWVLMFLRFPAAWQLHFGPFVKDQKLFCTYKDDRYRVVMASRLGDIGLRPARAPEGDSYEHRVRVTDCSNWSSEP